MSLDKPVIVDVGHRGAGRGRVVNDAGGLVGQECAGFGCCDEGPRDGDDVVYVVEAGYRDCRAARHDNRAAAAERRRACHDEAPPGGERHGAGIHNGANQPQGAARLDLKRADKVQRRRDAARQGAGADDFDLAAVGGGERSPVHGDAFKVDMRVRAASLPA